MVEWCAKAPCEHPYGSKAVGAGVARMERTSLRISGFV